LCRANPLRHCDCVSRLDRQEWRNTLALLRSSSQWPDGLAGEFLNLNPKCEPQLGRRGLYAAAGGHKDAPEQQMAILWVLNLSDGGHSLLDIAERASLPFTKIRAAADLLLAHGLLGKADRDQAAST
jgi:hypothetical protein